MRKLFLFLFLASCSSDSKLSFVCPTTCYSFNHASAGIGECSLGVPTYADNDLCELLTCTGEVGPKSEICNGKDDDCDGEVDEHVLLYAPHPSKSSPCEKHFGVCRTASWSCEAGEWVCDYGPDFEEYETRCDSKDNDCDGGVDEDLFRDESGNFQYCYSGNPAESVQYGECAPGFLFCLNGSVECGDTTPITEQPCNGLDDDCDGLIDEDFSNNVDIVYAIDDSGSMAGTIGSIVYSLEQFNQSLVSAPGNYRFALVGFTGTGSGGPLVHLVSDFVSLQDFLIVLGDVQSIGTGAEASLDAIHQVCSEQLELNWLPNSIRIYIGISDEPAQTYYSLTPDADAISNACLELSVSVHYFGNHLDEFDQITTQTGGKKYLLSNNSAQLLHNLNEILLTPCN